MWEYVLAALAALSADPRAVDLEPPQAAAAVGVAYAALAPAGEPQPVPPAPAPPGKCCAECKGSGSIVQPDGHRTDCPCPSGCKCKPTKRAEFWPEWPVSPAAPAPVVSPASNRRG